MLRSPTPLLAGCLLLSTAVPAGGVGFENHRIIARRAIDVLPAPIAPLFAANRPAFEERAVEPFAVWPRDPNLRRRQRWHWVGFDLEAAEQDRSARLRAAERFPRTESRANKAYGRQRMRNGGILPWAVEDLFHELVRAMQEDGEEDIVRAAGYLTHFAGCCASPFNATCNHDGRLTKNLYLGSLKVGDDGFAHQNVQYRFDLELVRRNGSRYQEQIALSGADYDPVAEPVGRAFEVLLASLGCVDEVLTADREILERLKVADGTGFAARADEYYVLLDERCGALCVERLRAGAILAGSLIGGAWEQAGQPSIEHIRSRGMPRAESATRTPGATSSDEPAPKSAGMVVGSKRSKVFHRPECPHVQRISTGNRVEFQSGKEAREQGRRPCRTCKPE